MKKLIIILFTVSFLIPLNSIAKEHVKMIRKDRVWVYFGEAADFRPGFYVRHYYHFGDEITINELTYTTFELYKSDYFKMRDCPANENDPNRVTLMREDAPRHYVREDEDGRVYVLGDQTDEYCKEQDCAYINFYPNKLPEEGYYQNYIDCLLYDFEIEDGTNVWGMFGGMYSIDYDSTEIKDLVSFRDSNIMIDGENCRVFSIGDLDEEKYVKHDFYIIEGVGINRNGCLANFELYDLACDAGHNRDYPGQISYLEGIYTPDEEPIYIFDDRLIKRLATVKDIQGACSQNESNAIYDLFGNKITNIQTGSIYICSGKKFVAR